MPPSPKFSNMLSEKIYFVAAVGTDIGKTFLVENLCRIIPNSQAIKPISSGFGDDDLNSDSARILAALGLEVSRNNLDLISPWRFEEAASPHFAAKNCGQEISFEAVKNFCFAKIAALKNSDQILFIEGAGGVMTPLTDDKTFLDLAAELQIPTILVTANYLGAISHTLCAVAALRSRQIPIANIIINEELPVIQKSTNDITQTLENMSLIPVLSLQKFFKNLLD